MSAKRASPTRNVSRIAALEQRFRRLVHHLERASGRALKVRLHRNRWTYFSCRAVAGAHRVRVSLHESFLDAPAEVLRAIATLIRRDDARARCVIRSFVKDQSPIWDKRADHPPRPQKIIPRGRVYDLRAIFNEINRRYFDGQCTAKITWGNGARTARGRRQITFGTYDKSSHVIRIHPALDHRYVPDYFVRYIAFHEMLHAMVPATLLPNGKRLFHSRVFRQREHAFKDFQRAQEWGKHFVEEVI